MKFALALLLATPAVLARSACKPRPAAGHSGHASSAAAISFTTVPSVAASVNSAPTEDKTATAVAPAKLSTTTAAAGAAKTTLATAVKPAATSSTKSTSSKSTSSSSTVLDGTAISGNSTQYGGNLSGGACSFTTYTLPKGILGTAYSGEVWDNAAECGACIEVTGPSGTAKAMIVDECPECNKGHLDLFPDTMSAIGGYAGIVPTSYKFVSCGITTPLQLHNKEGTSANWFSMQVVNSNVPVKSLEVSTDGGSTWKTTTRQTYNFFENSSGFGTSTVDVRVTSTTGKKIVVSGVSVAASSSATAASNF